MTRHLALTCLVALTALASLPVTISRAADTPPPGSVYRLPIQLTDQDGRLEPLNHWQGHPTIVALFYSSCQYVCPMIAETIEHIEGELSPADRMQLRVVMVTFDPERDTVDVLHRLAQDKDVDLERWSYVRGSEHDVRKLATILRVQYRKLPNGDFSHSTTITLLDRVGRIAARTDTIGTADPAFQHAVQLVVHE